MYVVMLQSLIAHSASVYKCTVCSVEVKVLFFSHSIKYMDSLFAHGLAYARAAREGCLVKWAGAVEA
jgi:hypothetical protein